MTTDAGPTIIPYDDFVETYRPIIHGIVEGVPERPMFETFGNDWETVKSTADHFVWTIVEVDLSDGQPNPYPEAEDDSCWLIVTGRHYVNRIGYMITEVPWVDYRIEAVYA